MRWLVVVVAAACSLERMQDQPRCTTDGILDGAPCNWPAPPGPGVVAWRDVPAPPPPLTRALVERGRDRYDRFCAACHGVTGDGDTEINRQARGRIPSLLTPVMIALPDAHVDAVIAGGIRTMPRQPLDPRDRRAVVHYLRVLQAGTP